MITFTFDGQTAASLGVAVLDVERPLTAQVDNEMLMIPGRRGGYFSGQKQRERYISIDVALVGLTTEGVQVAVRRLAGLLLRPDPRRLTFSDEPDVEYRALFDGRTDLERLAVARTGTLRFVCPDPHIYADVERSTTLVEGNNTLANNGSSAAHPRYSFAASGDVNMVRLENVSTGAYIAVGEPPPVGVTTGGGWQTVWDDTCSSVTGWTVGTSSDGGVVSGTMATNGTEFVASAYGTDGAAWRGPNLRRAIAVPFADFEVRTWVRMTAALLERGRVEVYLLDASAQIIGKIAMVDGTADNFFRAEARMGSHGHASSRFFVNYQPTPRHLWRNYNLGELTIRRVGNRWSASFGIQNPTTGVWHSRLNVERVDTSGAWAANLAFVEVHMGAHSTHAPLPHCRIDRVTVSQFVTPNAIQQPRLLRAGDMLEIDSHTSAIRINGYPAMANLQIGSQFFPIAPGDSLVDLTVVPAGSLSARTAFVRDRWL